MCWKRKMKFLLLSYLSSWLPPGSQLSYILDFQQAYPNSFETAMLLGVYSAYLIASWNPSRLREEAQHTKQKDNKNYCSHLFCWTPEKSSGDTWAVLFQCSCPLGQLLWYFSLLYQGVQPSTDLNIWFVVCSVLLSYIPLARSQILNSVITQKWSLRKKTAEGKVWVSWYSCFSNKSMLHMQIIIFV